MIAHRGKRMSTDVVLVYPYFNEERDKSIFRYPPLGIGYIAAVLQQEGIKVRVLDCTFSTPDRALSVIRTFRPKILGIYSMVTMNHHARWLAQQLRNDVELLVAGGPLPTLVPDTFMDLFDVVVLGEGEYTFLELVQAHLDSRPWDKIPGIAYAPHAKHIQLNDRRELEPDLNKLPLPAREMFPNQGYKKYWKRYHGYTATNLISSRGCPYNCDFCSSPIFGRSYRERSADSVCAEMVEIESLGYERAFFSDDCFTLNPKRVRQVCESLIKENLDLKWMCLSRVDTLSRDMAAIMAKAGCAQVFFGIESGSPRVLQIMNKRINLDSVRHAIAASHNAGIKTGGFFILGYPGETNESLLETLRFSSRLSLDYLSYSFPYPIIGTGLYEKVAHVINQPEWRKQKGHASRHQLLFEGGFSEGKLHFASAKGLIEHLLRKKGLIGESTADVFERITDALLPKLT
jgi:anaerobic magnesium-protoporphyrin IX monomethyl ester cyclase